MSTIELNNLTFTYPERSFSLDVEDKHFADPMVAIVKKMVPANQRSSNC